MTRDPRYDLLFEPVTIGPVTAPNRFYQVPHCSGMGNLRPHTHAAMRGMKAEGGWGVVCTEYCSIHGSSDDTPHPYASLWDEGDERNVAAFADAVHAHGALAGVELWHGGSRVANLVSREPTLGASSLPCYFDPTQSQPMDLCDIKALQGWHRAAALRARTAGCDIVYVYASHGYLLSEFLSRTYNQRTDTYGGSLENRARLVRELLDITKDAVGDRCAVALRMSANGHGDAHLSAEEATQVIEMVAPAVDLFDLIVGDYSHEMGSSRFVQEGSLEDHIAHVRTLTGKPVVSVGRFTSPDTMASQVRRGVLDLIGAARPSIADPFLPEKIRSGRIEDIRECIGCNICYATNSRGATGRCTQNPTMGEEWRSGWHPERVERDAAGSVLIVGAGPAGLEAAHILGKRGFDVTLADAAAEPGGRVSRESRLPGLGEWARVRDYRLGQLSHMANVQLYLESDMSAAEVREFGADHVLIATGARWRRDGVGRFHDLPIEGTGHERLLSADDIMDGVTPEGPVIVYDDDNYYLGPVIAEKLARAGCAVTYVTSRGIVGAWTSVTSEQAQSQARLIECGVDIVVSSALSGFDGTTATLACAYSGRETVREANHAVLVTIRSCNDRLFRELVPDDGNEGDASIMRIGDCRQPSIIAAAVYAGHRAGRELGLAGEMPERRRDRVVVG
jgi:dimethylamine/trimethylamine dehydrogenase